VIVTGPNKPDGHRSYHGGPGSPAHGRFERYLRLYEALALDDPKGLSDTDGNKI
jgi:hypothetical protein